MNLKFTKGKKLNPDHEEDQPHLPEDRPAAKQLAKQRWTRGLGGQNLEHELAVSACGKDITFL